MQTLTEIANSLQLDKGTLPAAECSWHADYPDHETLGYTEVYDRFITAKRERVNKFLEIGICDPRFPGSSLKMWCEYFPVSTIWAIDNFWGREPPIEFLDSIRELPRNRVRLRRVDQSSRGQMAEFFSEAGSGFDFMVEDGAHWPSHIMISLACCFDHLKSGGVYFIEDLQTEQSAGHAAYDNLQITKLFGRFVRTGELGRLYITREEHASLLKSIAKVEMFGENGPSRLVAITKK